MRRPAARARQNPKPDGRLLALTERRRYKLPQELFTTLLGAEPTADSPYYPYYIGYDVGGQQIGLVPNGHASQGMTGTTAFSHVDDINARMQAVLDGGGAGRSEIASQAPPAARPIGHDRLKRRGM